MIRLKQLSVSGFRGIRGTLSLKFGACQSIAIYGDNAAGKSSITDAIEWFYFERVDHLWKENCKADSLRNILISPTAEAIIEVKFDDNKLNTIKSISSLLATSTSNRTPAFSEYLAKVRNGNERVVLRTVDIVMLSLQTKAERRKDFEKIIGYEALNNFREIIISTLNRLEKTPEYITAMSNEQEQQREILKIARKGILREKELFETGSEIATSAGVLSPIVDSASYDSAIAELQAKLQDKEKAIRKAALADCRALCELLSPRVSEMSPTISEFSRSYDELIASEEHVRQLRLRSFLTAGAEALDNRSVALDTCPLCLQPAPWEQLREDLKARISALNESNRRFQVAMSAKSKTLSAISRAAKAGSDFESAAVKLRLDSEYVLPVQDFVTKLRELERAISENFDNLKPIPTEVGEVTSRAVAASHRAGEWLREQENLLELSAEEQKLLAALRQLETLNTQFRKFEKTTQTIKTFRQQIAALSTIKDHFTTIHREALQKALDTMSDDIRRYYLAMHPRENVDDIELKVIEDGIEFEYKFHGKRVYPPPKYLSESHLNSLAISAFLASAKIFNKLNSFVVLDDVVTSFDANHRLRLLRLLKEEFSGWQVVILTHEHFWFEMIKRELAPTGWLTQELEAGSGYDVRLKDSAGSIQEEIDHAKRSSGLNANALRSLLEKSLKEIGFCLEVRMAFRYNEENERRMAGELLSELRATLKRHSPAALANPVFSKLAVCSLVTTTGSHDSGPILSAGDIDVVAQDIAEFDGQYFCSECRQYVSVERFVTHEEKLYCKCGKKHIEWKE